MTGDERGKDKATATAGRCNATSRKRGRPPCDDVLTPAEWRVIHGAQHGLTNKAIASKLGISADGVKYHIGNALGKLQLANKSALKSWFKQPKASALAEKMKVELSGTEAGSSPSKQVQKKEKTMNDKATASKVIQGLGQVSRTVRSLQQSVEFYKNQLGIAHLYTFGNLAFFDLGGSRLFLNETTELNEAESILYFKVAEIKQACDRLSEAGVEVSNQPHLIHTHEDGTEEWMAFVKDLEGRALGLMSSVRSAA